MAPGISSTLIDTHGGSSTTSLLLIDGAGGVDELAMVSAALNVWDAASGFTNLGQVSDGGADWGDTDASGAHLGDIRIGALSGFGGELAHAYQPGTNAIFSNGSVGGDVHFDNGFNWIDDPGNAGGGFDFFTVALHELGHSLGLGHSADPNAVMFPTYAGTRRTLSADDIAGIQAIYGVQQQQPSEPIAIPEPSTFALLGLGAIGLNLRSRRRRTA